MSRQTFHRSTTGFTLIEMIVVLMIVSILALIAAPSWLAFMNSRRAQAGTDQVLQFLRQAQAQAVRTRQTQVVNFVTAANQLPVVETSGISQTLNAQTTGNTSKSLLGLQVLDGTSSRCAANAVGCVVFDEYGNVKRDDSALGEKGIRIVVTSPASSNNKRCVIVKTLLGAMQSSSGADCN